MRKLLAFLLALQLCSPVWAQIVMPGGGGAGSITSVASTCPATTTSSGAATVPNGVTSIAKSSAYTVLPSDCGKFFEVTGNTTITLPGFSGGGSVGAGFATIIQNAGTGTVTITASSGNIFNGTSAPSVTITSGQQVGLVVNSSVNGWDGTPAGISAATIIGPGYQAGPFYVPFMEPPQATAQAALAITVAYCTPIWFNNILAAGGGSATLAQLFIRATVLGSSNVTAALYANDLTANPFRPGALLTNGATPQTPNTSAASFAGLIPFTTGPSVSANTLYWSCLQTGDTTMTYSGVATTQGAPMSVLVGAATTALSGTSGSGISSGVSVSVGSFGTWPSTLHGSTFTDGGNGRTPWFGFQFASIP